MTRLIVACVRSGERYGIEYVERLAKMVKRHLPLEHTFVCLTDQPDRCDGVDFLDMSFTKLPGWWMKMALFRSAWRYDRRVLFFDLDTVVIGDITMLAQLDVRFGISLNFARAFGATSWPCNYASSTMVLGPDLDDDVWYRFEKDASRLMIQFERTGDQHVIENFYPRATILQTKLPRDYLLNYRAIGPNKPTGSSVIVFGGKSKPHNSAHQWVRDEWTA